MIYRNSDNLKAKTSLLGFGCMRFPQLPDKSIDKEQAKAMLEHGRASGINYFDTAWFYHGGTSETFLGEVIAQWPQDEFYLATKLPCVLLKTLDDAKATYEKQKERLGRDYFDFYLLHNLHRETWDRVKEEGILDWAIELQAQGKIGRIGFSFHDEYEVFEEIMNYRQWDFCQIQLNYLDTKVQAGMKGYELATQMGVPVVIMEPVKGGMLANLPSQIAAPLKEMHPDWSLAAWAVRWIATLPNVLTVLSGMSTMEQVEDNIATVSGLEPLGEAELALLDQVAVQMDALVKSPCTRCGYCMPCPAGVNIPRNFDVWNRASLSEGGIAGVMGWKEMPDHEKAGNCVGCGACEAACPQQIPIINHLAQLKDEMEALI